MNNLVNLDQVGVQSKSAKQQADQSETHHADVKAHAGKMDAMRKDFKGAGGATFTRAAAANAESGAEVGKRLAELALAAVRAEKEILQADETSGQDQQASVSSNESTRGLVSKSINA